MSLRAAGARMLKTLARELPAAAPGSRLPGLRGRPSWDRIGPEPRPAWRARGGMGVP